MSRSMAISKMNISVFSKIPNLLQELRSVSPNLNFVEISAEHPERLQESEIIIGDFNLLALHIYNLPKAKWVQGTWAGLDTLMPHIDKPLPFLLTRFSGHHFGQMMSEYVIANIVNHERDLYLVNDNQKTRTWSGDGKVYDHRTISELNIGIMGIGQIGSWVARCLNMLGAYIIGFARRPALEKSEKNKYIAEYYSKSNLAAFLSKSDYVINVLPSTVQTKGLLNGGVLEYCKERKSVFINVGRGTIIDEKDLIHALDSGWLSAAIVDVFAEEPLPKDSPLWSMKQVRITPHSSAVSKPKHIAEQFQLNYELYVNNKHIPTTVDVTAQY